MKKILIFGSNGMAGHMVTLYLKTNSAFQVITVDKNSGISGTDHLIDVTDFKGVNSIINEESPDVIINCIGILNEYADKNPDLAILLNSYFPHYLERLGSVSFKLIHISTDCVFSGNSGGYKENDFRDGTGYYAITKALGEIDNSKDLTLRTSIIGPELKNDGIGLFDWFMKQTGIINGFTNAFWTGVTTLHLAKAIEASIQQDIKGLYHLVNNRKISKHDLLVILKEIFNKDNVQISPLGDYKSDKSLINTRTDFKYVVPDYPIMISELKSFMDKQIKTYGKYYHSS